MIDESSHFSVIVGLGATGLACADYLSKQHIPFAITDSRQQPPLLTECQQRFPGVEMALGGFSAEMINQANQLIVSPGVSVKEPALLHRRNQQVKLIGDIELFARAVKKPVIAITGSNGKSTVTTLMGDMIRAAGYRVAVGGNLGQPALSLLNDDSVDYYVLELSSFQLETTYSLKPQAAVLLNLSPDHMDRYDHVDAYLQAKQRVYQHCQHAVVNADEPTIWELLSFSQPPVSFSLSAPQANQFGLVHQDNVVYLAKGKQLLLSANDMTLKGKHFLQNALATLALGDAIGLPMSTMLSVVKHFQGLPHRCQLVREHQGVVWYNDSKGTNVGATLMAINSLSATVPGQLILIAGGDAKKADLSPLLPAIKQHVRHLILLGKDAPLFEAKFKEVVALSCVNDMLQAVNLANELAKPGEAVLLSPACASFDMFRHFEHRGDVFMQAVEAL